MVINHVVNWMILQATGSSYQTDLDYLYYIEINCCRIWVTTTLFDGNTFPPKYCNNKKIPPKIPKFPSNPRDSMYGFIVYITGTYIYHIY